MPYSQRPFAEKEGQAAEQNSSGKSARDHDRFEQRANMRPKASIHSIHSFGRKSDEVASDRPPIRRRPFRTLIRFLVAILIGVGGTLAWQSYGDAATQMIATQSPTLSWLLSAWPAKSPLAVASANPAQQPGFPASGLDAIRRSVEQLAARQEQMAQNMATLQAVEEDIRQKMSFTPASVPAVLAQPAAPVSQHKPAPRVPSSVALTR